MKTRIFHTKFWTDTYIRRLKPDEKLAFVYLITNEFVNVIDLYELPTDIASQQTSIDEDRLKEILEKFQSDEKIIWFKEYVYLSNAFKYQYYKGPKNNHLKLRLIFELNDALLQHFKKEIISIIDDIKNEHTRSDNKDEKITNLLRRVIDRLIDRGIYTGIDKGIHTPMDTGYKPETINHKPENRKGKGDNGVSFQREGKDERNGEKPKSKGYASAKEIADRLRVGSVKSKGGDRNGK